MKVGLGLGLGLGLPGDFTGGMMLFIIAIAITIIELFIVKKQANIAFRRGIRSPEEFACKGIGGTWYPNRDSKDPCCMLPTNISKVDVDGFPICRGVKAPFP